MNVLVVGAGRMGQRHVRGALAARGVEWVHVVDPRAEARAEAEALDARVTAHGSLDAAPLDAVGTAILAETAAGRLERAGALVAAGVERLLVEKPAEQSRERLRELVAACADVDASCNHHLRALPFLQGLRDDGGPFEIHVVGGAYGLACNGIHWLDVAVFLSGGGGELLFGELEAERVFSPRGAEFCDYGGRGLFGFRDGSRLLLASATAGSAPMAAVISQPNAQYFLDLHDDFTIAFRRDPASDAPPWRYGADYTREEVRGEQAVDMSDVTRRWLAGELRLPTLAEAAEAHELLFDLLETSGERSFAIT